MKKIHMYQKILRILKYSVPEVISNNNKELTKLINEITGRKYRRWWCWGFLYISKKK